MASAPEPNCWSKPGLGALGSIKRVANLLSDCVESGPRWLGSPVGNHLESVSLVTRENMEMGMEDLLVSGFAIGVEEVDAVAAETTS
jgi:hypothetical protein